MTSSLVLTALLVFGAPATPDTTATAATAVTSAESTAPDLVTSDAVAPIAESMEPTAPTAPTTPGLLPAEPLEMAPCFNEGQRQYVGTGLCCGPAREWFEIQKCSNGTWVNDGFLCSTSRNC